MSKLKAMHELAKLTNPAPEAEILLHLRSACDSVATGGPYAEAEAEGEVITPTAAEIAYVAALKEAPVKRRGRPAGTKNTPKAAPPVELPALIRPMAGIVENAEAAGGKLQPAPTTQAEMEADYKAVVRTELAKGNEFGHPLSGPAVGGEASEPRFVSIEQEWLAAAEQEQTAVQATLVAQGTDLAPEPAASPEEGGISDPSAPYHASAFLAQNFESKEKPWGWWSVFARQTEFLGEIRATVPTMPDPALLAGLAEAGPPELVERLATAGGVLSYLHTNQGALKGRLRALEDLYESAVDSAKARLDLEALPRSPTEGAKLQAVYRDPALGDGIRDVRKRQIELEACVDTQAGIIAAYQIVWETVSRAITVRMGEQAQEGRRT